MHKSTRDNLRASAIRLATCTVAFALAAPAPAQTVAANLEGASSQARSFYQGRSGPAWSDATAQQLLAALRGAERHGLDAGQFVRLLRGSGSPAERDLGLTEAALSYADALAHGVVDPAALHDVFTLRTNRVDLAAGLESALRAGAVERWISGLAPNDPEYQQLSLGYLRARAAASQPRPPAIENGPLIRLGDADPRLAGVLELLRWKGFAAAPLSRPLTLDPAMVSAIESFQRTHGLTVDGIVGPATLSALNRGPADEARQIALNLERWRWLDRAPPADRVDVNIAAAKLTYVRDGRPAWTTRVVVGSPDWATPALQETFTQLVVNPPWNVPSSIAQQEILPKGPGYLAANDMYVRDGRVVQRPGPDSALGLVKFDMQNRYAIYLHDTPAKSLFGSDHRHRSHGCVRVEDAVAFARRLAEERGRGAALEAALASGATRTVQLGEPVAVRLLYRTAYADGDRIAFADDVYGRDERLAEALGLGTVRRSQTRPYAVIPVGP
jgi:murein L,D-transpeptidase YcbB/YkuD